jgi:membrane protease YdiL (CAAX protease family)
MVTDESIGAARATLEPALRTWLVYEALWGGYYLIFGFVRDPSPVATAVAYLVTTCVCAVWISRQAWRDRAHCRLFVRPRRGVVEMCLLVGVVGAILLAMLESNIASWNSETTTWEQAAGWPFWLMLIPFAVLPAVFEELLYRGVVLHRLHAVLSMPMAIAVQAMLFSMMHLDGVYVLPHFAFGCLAGFLRLAARALWPCMLMHFLWNGWIAASLYGMW